MAVTLAANIFFSVIGTLKILATFHRRKNSRNINKSKIINLYDY